MTAKDVDCVDCAGVFIDTRQQHYDHVHPAEILPEEGDTDTGSVVAGYAVGFAGDELPQTWIFFADLEPAIAFGRAGRMSSYDITSYGVYEAARETRHVPGGKGRLVTLYIRSRDLRDHDAHVEAPILERWIKGCHPDSAYFERE
ncbi:hypothetical protein GCM10010182_61170 [Actinomadura cremea]|nr:hypothetical protein GCM10010182_61170 [Actinomadura cremea]